MMTRILAHPLEIWVTRALFSLKRKMSISIVISRSNSFPEPMVIGRSRPSFLLTPSWMMELKVSLMVLVIAASA